ncbi:MAG: efflux RND transporter periplasmic adaptor subunit [Bacteroidales bacterium]|jgi:membrane fusion protein (multidrug efflux system)|nr:efflux RND transporter periplasmic adaptor subunit [Bacteroidales bacterium]
MNIRYLMVILSAAGLLAGCKSTNKRDNSPAVPVKVITVTAGPYSQNMAYSAIIQGTSDVEIRPKVQSYIEAEYVNEGDFVHKGQLLFLLDTVQYKAAVRVAEANVKAAEAGVEAAELTLQTKKNLYKKNITSEYEYLTAEIELRTKKATLSQAEAELTNASRNLSYTYVTSPMAGIVGVITHTPGNLIGPSMTDALTVISDITVMRVYFSLSERQLLSLVRHDGSIANIIKNMPAVSLRLSDGCIYKEKGKVVAISGVVDKKTGAVRARADFRNPSHILKSGFTGNVLIPAYFDSAIVIPQKATFEIQDRKFVYTVTDSSTVVSRPITVNPMEDGDVYVVMDGLKVGEKIVAEGAEFLKERQKIIVTE